MTARTPHADALRRSHWTYDGRWRRWAKTVRAGTVVIQRANCRLIARQVDASGKTVSEQVVYDDRVETRNALQRGRGRGHIVGNCPSEDDYSD